MSDSKMANVSPVSSRSGTPEMSEDEDRARPSRKRLSEDQLTAKFRQFLLFGNTKEALDWAMKHGLWGHALFLASKMDARTYANVMTRFANGLSLNDPLQTLYQLMSGRQPAAVTVSC
jgi:COPII coat assembly protein SEC16